MVPRSSTCCRVPCGRASVLSAAQFTCCRAPWCRARHNASSLRLGFKYIYIYIYRNVGRGNLTSNGPGFIEDSEVVGTQIRSLQPTQQLAASPVRSQSEPRSSRRVADQTTSTWLDRPRPTTFRPIMVPDRKDDGRSMPRTTRPAFLVESQEPVPNSRSNLPMSSFACASTPYSYPGAQSTLGRPVPVSVPRTSRETAVGTDLEWSSANGALGRNACLGAQSYGWKREPYCPPYQTMPWVRSNDTQVKTVVMTSVATQTTG